MKYILAIFTAFLLLTFSVNSQKVYHVSQSGSDAAAGTLSAPLKTLDKAWEKIRAGDTVKITGKMMFDRMQNLFGRNGTTSAPIVIMGVNATLTRSPAFNQTHSNELIYFTGNFVKWINIEMSDFSQRPGEHAYPAFRAVNSSNCTWERINYHHNGAAFSIKGKSSNNEIINSDFHHIEDPYSAEPYDGGDGINIHDCTGTNNIVMGCRAWWNSDDGFDFWNNTGHVTIENCWSFYNGFKPGTFTTAGNGTGIKLGGGENVNNTVNRVVKNNLCYYNGKHGIVQNNAISALIQNNTVVKHSSHGIWTGSWGGGPCDLRNNISYKSSGDNARLNTRDKAGNNSWQGIAVKDSDFESWDESQLLAVRNADGSLPGLTFLKPIGALAGIGATFTGEPGGPVDPPDDPGVTLLFTIHVYTDNTINKSKKPSATKTLWFDLEVYSDGTIKKK